MALSRASAPRLRFVVPAKPYAITTNRSELLRWSPPNHRFCREADQALTKLMGSELVLSSRYGRRIRPIRFNRFPRKRQGPWLFGWPERKAFLPGLPQAVMSLPLCD